MRILGYILLCMLALLGIVGQTTVAAAQVPEIPDVNLPDIAMVTWHVGPLPPVGLPMYNGPVIIYNPKVIAQVGPALTAFFRSHEYCHVARNHIQQQFFFGNPYNKAWISQGLELDADSCATVTLLSQGNIASVRAAFLWFLGQGPIQHVPSHPPGQARAMNIANTAKSMGVSP